MYTENKIKIQSNISVHARRYAHKVYMHEMDDGRVNDFFTAYIKSF